MNTYMHQLLDILINIQIPLLRFNKEMDMMKILSYLLIESMELQRNENKKKKEKIMRYDLKGDYQEKRRKRKRINCEIKKQKGKKKKINQTKQNFYIQFINQLRYNQIKRMWYKYFSKQSWNLRVWRKANLKYNQDDFGMTQPKYIARFGDFRFRLVRTEGALRGCMFFVGFGCISIFNYLYGRYGYILNEESQKRAAQELIDNDNAAEKILFKNRVGAPTRPLRSLDDIMAFLSGSATYDQLADYASYNHAMDVNQDQQAGLDSWMSEKDKNMVKYYQKSLGKKVEGI